MPTESKTNALPQVNPGESWRHYLDRLRQAPEITPEIVAGTLAVTGFMKSDPKGSVDQDKLLDTTDRLLKQPSIRAITQDPRAQRLTREGRNMELTNMAVARMRTKELELSRYQRTKESAAEDLEFLRAALKAIKEGEAKGSPAQRERESQRLTEMVKRMEYAQGLLEKGIPLNGKVSRELVGAAMNYQNGGGKTPDGKQAPSASKEALCVMKHFMPQEEFSNYCDASNKALGAQSMSHPRHLDPKNYPPTLVTGGAAPAKELMAVTQRQLYNGLSTDACAAVSAIHKLSKGNPNAPISQTELQREISRLKTPGSAFMRTMGDPSAREKLTSLAATGKMGTFSRTLDREARTHSIRAAQWQINESVKELKSSAGGKNAAQHLANILAARELAASKDPGERITVGAFQQRAAQIQKTEAFSRVAEKYNKNPGFRSRIDRDLAGGGSGGTLVQEMQREKQPTKVINQPELVLVRKQD